MDSMNVIFVYPSSMGVVPGVASSVLFEQLNRGDHVEFTAVLGKPAVAIADQTATSGTGATVTTSVRAPPPFTSPQPNRWHTTIGSVRIITPPLSSTPMAAQQPPGRHRHAAQHQMMNGALSKKCNKLSILKQFSAAFNQQQRQMMALPLASLTTGSIYALPPPVQQTVSGATGLLPSPLPAYARPGGAGLPTPLAAHSPVAPAHMRQSVAVSH
jgi:hypothetical protein